MKKPKDEYYYKCPHNGIGNSVNIMYNTCEDCQQLVKDYYQYSVLKRQLKEKKYIKVSKIKGKGAFFIEAPEDVNINIVEREL